MRRVVQKNALASDDVKRTVGGNNLYERSVRDVYEALELDFESFE